MTAFNGDAVDKKGFWWLENKAGSYIPNIIGKVMDDPFIRETEGFMDVYKKRLGGMDLPKTYNVLGEAILDSTNKPGRLFNNLFNPMTVKNRRMMKY